MGSDFLDMLTGWDVDHVQGTLLAGWITPAAVTCLAFQAKCLIQYVQQHAH